MKNRKLIFIGLFIFLSVVLVLLYTFLKVLILHLTE